MGLVVAALSLSASHPYLTHESKESGEIQLEREVARAEVAVTKKDKVSQIPLAKFSRENRRRVELFNTFNCDRLTRRIYMEDGEAEIHSPCYLLLHDALVSWLRPVVQDLVNLHREASKTIRKRKKNPGAMLRDFDVRQVLELRGFAPRDTYFQRLREGRVLKSDSVLLGGDEPEEGEETPYSRALRKILKRKQEQKDDSDDDDHEPEDRVADAEEKPEADMVEDYGVHDSGEEEEEGV